MLTDEQKQERLREILYDTICGGPKGNEDDDAVEAVLTAVWAEILSWCNADAE